MSTWKFKYKDHHSIQTLADESSKSEGCSGMKKDKNTWCHRVIPRPSREKTGTCQCLIMKN